MDPKRIKRFQKEILGWYQKNKRDLPWRRTRDPYHILVSEIMLQQTQVSRVIPKYEEWLKKFPTIESLAKAKTSDVLRAWSGLGYNRRALYLKKIAEIISNGNGLLTHVVNDVRRPLSVGQSQNPSSLSERRSPKRKRLSNSKIRSASSSFASGQSPVFPRSIEELKKLPGIGEYTARAIACFAFDQQVAVVDTNIRKVILIHFGKNHPERSRRNFGGVEGSHRDSGQVPPQRDPAFGGARMTAKEIQRIADQLLPIGKAYDWNHALMDYSAAVLKRNKVPSASWRTKAIQVHRLHPLLSRADY